MRLALQSLGRALMLPIAVLPAAALLLRLGQPDLLGIAVFAAAGDAVFSNLGLIFAVGVAVGLARENHGAAGLAGLVAYLVTTHGAEGLLSVPPAALAGVDAGARELAEHAWRTAQIAKLSVPAGILCGVMAGVLYNRYSGVQFPPWLAFFGGRRFVPIAAGFGGVALALLFGWGAPALWHGMEVLSAAVLGAGSAGMFAYGVLNRLLLVTGLHHILNNLAWFLIGDWHGVTGDLKRFFAGDPTAGGFMSGFFPVMMFGLPAACLAMYHSARPERRRAVGGMLLSMALTSALTGVTEPIEFSFMFLAPALYVLHAVMTGLAMWLMHVLGVHLGFGFSAGLFDYVLNFSRATRPLWLLPVGLLWAAAYYGLFRLCIVRFDLPTPGRERDADGPTRAEPAPPLDADSEADAVVAALGGAANLLVVSACTTRLRLQVGGAPLDETALRRLGAVGIVRPSSDSAQIVLGPKADLIAGRIRARLGQGAPQASAADAFCDALGGGGNVHAIERHGERLLIEVHDVDRVDQARLAGAFVAAIGCTGRFVHVAGGDRHSREAIARRLEREEARQVGGGDPRSPA